MKKITLLFALLSLTTFYSQTEISVEANSGLFSFTGNTPSNTSGIIDGSNKYTNNPYGKKADLAFGFSGNVKYVFENKFLIGSSIGFESLRSKTDINIIYRNQFDGTDLTASGKTNLIYNTINLFPYFGYRIPTKSINLDVSVGTDIGFILSAKEKGSAKASDNNLYETSVDRKIISTDFRPRIQMNATYQKFGVYLGYSFGTINYLKDYIGGNFDAKSRMLRFGLTYQLK